MLSDGRHIRGLIGIAYDTTLPALWRAPYPPEYIPDPEAAAPAPSRSQGESMKLKALELTLALGAALRRCQLSERILDFGDQLFAPASGIDAYVVARRKLANRLELYALPSAHLGRGVRHLTLHLSATLQPAYRVVFADDAFDEEHRNAAPGSQRQCQLPVRRCLERRVENRAAAVTQKALRLGEHRVISDFRKPF